MKTLLVTSRVTLVPDNYDELIVGLADCPRIAGLLELENRNRRLLLKMLGLGLTVTPRLSLTFLYNWFGATGRRRRAAYNTAGKPVWSLPSINTPETVTLVKEHDIDLILNARTRSIYGPDVLAAPRLGCLNIHHGLLPEQRGTMCDLWALHEGRPAGFSIHVMSSDVDGGPLLVREKVSDGSDRDFSAYLRKTVRQELAAITGLLARIEDRDSRQGMPNVAPSNLTHYRNPTFTQLRTMRSAGMRL